MHRLTYKSPSARMTSFPGLLFLQSGLHWTGLGQRKLDAANYCRKSDIRLEDSSCLLRGVENRPGHHLAWHLLHCGSAPNHPTCLLVASPANAVCVGCLRAAARSPFSFPSGSLANEHLGICAEAGGQPVHECQRNELQGSSVLLNLRLLIGRSFEPAAPA